MDIFGGSENLDDESARGDVEIFEKKEIAFHQFKRSSQVKPQVADDLTKTQEPA